MKKKFYPIILVILGMVFLGSINSPRQTGIIKSDAPGVNARNAAAGMVTPDLDFGKFPLYFIGNQGQVNRKAKFYANASRYTLWLTKEGLVFDSVRRENHKSQNSNYKQIPNSNSQITNKLQPDTKGIDSAGRETQNSPHHSSLITHNSAPPSSRDVSRLMFIGANKNPEIIPFEKSELKVNYFKGSDKSKWNCDIPTSQAVLYKSLYKNIDLKVYGIEKQVEYDWIVKPGGSPADIRFVYKNVKSTRIDEKGNLLIETAFGEMVHKKPFAYQESIAGTGTAHNLASQKGLRSEKNSRIPVEVTFKKTAENTYGFSVADYDKSRELVIDPLILLYSTYSGGGGECGYGIAVDGSGYVYVTGRTYSLDFPVVNQYQTYSAGLTDVFITKLDTTRGGKGSLLYSTYLGGGSYDAGHAIAVDGSGCAYVTGYTYGTDFPTLNQYQSYQGGLMDAFVTKIDTTKSGPDGLIYSTCLGGDGGDIGYGIVVDGSGIAYIAGKTWSTDFPVLNQYQTFQGIEDAFITKLDTTKSGTAGLLYSTYLGGGSHDYGHAIAVDDSGYVYVAGCTSSSTFPMLNQYQTFQGGEDAFIAKLDITQSGAAVLVYSTCLGGSSYDYGNAVVVDGSGYVYVTGRTLGSDFPMLNQYQTFQGDDDAYIAKLDTTKSGTAGLLYSSYLGGKRDDYGFSIAVDAGGCAYVAGYTKSEDFPLLNEYQEKQNDYDSSNYGDAFVIQVDTTRKGANSLVYSTCLGGDDMEYALGIALDDSGSVYLTGETRSSDFPLRNQHHGYQDGEYAFVTKLTYRLRPTVTTSTISSVTMTSASCGGNVTSDGGAEVTARGVCRHTSAEPTTSDRFTTDGAGTGAFTSSLAGLSPGTVYYVRAYATNSVGTAYGQQRKFRTLNIVLLLSASRESESAWLLRREYGKLAPAVENPHNIAVGQYIIYRKEADGNYQLLKGIPGSELASAGYEYLDKFLHKDRSYTYKFIAVDPKGATIKESNEITI
ncbi:MAG: SBBP repeat-containing protein [Candidatus Aminicenantes bacterium]|nr:SBBP repeat-containing protein [Candidatus Aminicenantes bacterium]